MVSATTTPRRYSPTAGCSLRGGEDANPVATAELYNPASGTWSPTGSLHQRRYLHTATLLLDGRVLVAGGCCDEVNYLASAELYDPATGTWSETGAMHDARLYHTATLLADGRALAAGGEDNHFNDLARGELYDPQMGTWSPTGSLHQARYLHTATLLLDGRVLAAGGFGPCNPYCTDLASAELFIETPCTGRAEETEQPYVAFGRGWRHATDAQASGGGVALASTPGAQASFTFPGRGTRLIATVGPKMGKLDVAVDGRYYTTVDLYAPVVRHQVVVAFVHGLAQGSHTVTYTVRSDKNTLSSGYWCPLDRFDHHVQE